jgi:hypothetical protein
MTRYPNAQRHLLGGLFISHAGADTKRIIRDVVPVVAPRLPGDGFFMHSRGSGGASSYRELVQAALHWCDKFLVVISERSLANEWVLAETEWAMDRSRPMIAIRLDKWNWSDLVRLLSLSPRANSHAPVRCFDFHDDSKAGQKQLAEALDQLLELFPRRGFSTG